ncbi:MAG TPA: hypothetical protein VHV77_08505, partial [Pirellulales bacterium]|nr:hypothetical protein [Pirellulales bacterium]
DELLEENAAPDDASIDARNHTVLAIISSIMTGAGIVVCIVAGLLGWLLTMKKKVLQCSQCAARFDTG